MKTSAHTWSLTSFNWLIVVGFILLPAQVEAKWFLMTSPHFELYSDGSQSNAKSIIRYLEEVRVTFKKIYPGMPEGTRPLRIIAFNSEKAFKKFSPRESAYAFYFRNQDRDYIVFQALETNRMNSVAVHEYTHLLIEETGLHLPVWLEEGLAEFFSTMAERPDGIAVGAPPGRAQVLSRSWLKPEELLNTSRMDSKFWQSQLKVQTLYAQGWLLAHMLSLQQDYAPKFSEFLAAIGAGVTEEDAFLEIYGKTFKELDRDLQRYKSGTSIPLMVFPVEWERRDESIEVRPATELESGLVEADLQLRMRHRSESNEEYRRLAEIDPDNAEVEAGLARLAEEDEDALAHFERAVKLGGQDPFLYFDYALKLMRTGGDRDRVQALLEKASSLDPNLTDVHLVLAAYAVEKSSDGKALEHFNRVKKIEYTLAFTTFGRMWELYRKVDNPQAADLVVKQIKSLALTLADVHAAERMNAVVTGAGQPSRLTQTEELLSRKEYGQAAELLAALVEEYAFVDQLHTKLAEAYTGLGDKEKARSHEEQALKLSRENILAVRREARAALRRDFVYHEAGLHDWAYEIQTRLMALDPGDGSRENDHAYQLAERGQALDKALELAKIAVRLRPDEAGILDTLGWVYYKMSRTEEAVETFERAMQAGSPGCKDCRGEDVAVVQYHFGMVLLQAGDKTRAKHAFETALKRKPTKSLEQDIRRELAELK